jgi:hypothetical protein
MQPYASIKNSLNLGHHAASKFDVLNAHILNSVVVPGELIIIGDASTQNCTAFEAGLMSKASEIHWALLANGAGGDGFILDNYELINSVIGHSSLGIGAVSGAWGKRLKEIEETLGSIDNLYRQSFGSNSILSRNEFITRRRMTFDLLDRQLRGFASYGTGLRNEGSIKRMLGISTNSYIQHGEILGYAQKIAGVARAAKVMKAGGYLGIGMDTGAAGLSIYQACTVGREADCTKAKYVEGAKLAATLGFGTAGGAVGTSLMIGLCTVGGVLSGGLGMLACIIVGGAVGGYGGGALGEAIGENFGEKIYAMIEG